MAGDYQNAAGSATCKSCSTSSTSVEPGSTECTCIGLNRGFQPSDGYCTCDPGFEFYDYQRGVVDYFGRGGAGNEGGSGGVLGTAGGRLLVTCPSSTRRSCGPWRVHMTRHVSG